jgi:hypothetical protein
LLLLVLVEQVGVAMDQALEPQLLVLQIQEAEAEVVVHLLEPQVVLE